MNESKTRLRRLSAFAVVTVFASLFTLGSGVALAATTRYVAPGGSDLLNTCMDKQNPCATVQHAVVVAAPGDLISLAKGTYVEQVTINKSLTIEGDGMDKSVIKAPAALAPDGSGARNIVEINMGATVDASKLTVAGPFPGCEQSGIAIIQMATLNIDHAAVRDIRPPTDGFCGVNASGDAIRAGTQRGFGGPEVGTITVDHVAVTDYNRNGITVVGMGSTGTIEHSKIETVPSPDSSPNGVVAQSGAVFTADHNKISGNQCTIPTTCGPDLAANTQSTGYLSFSAGPGVSISHSDVSGNDVGIFVTGGTASIGQTVEHNKVDKNIYAGLVVNGRMGTDIVVDKNHFAKNGNHGIFLGAFMGGVFLPYSGAGTFSDNHGNGHAIYDFYWDGSGTPTFDHNHCGTAFPSKAAWDC